MILSTLDKSRKGGAYEQIPSLVLGQRWTPQLNSRNMMKVVLCVWIEPYIETDLSFCVWPVHTPTTSKEVLTLSASTSPLPYTGNKSCIVNTILSVMPKHTVYIDPCMGSAEVKDYISGQASDGWVKALNSGRFRWMTENCMSISGISVTGVFRLKKSASPQNSPRVFPICASLL